MKTLLVLAGCLRAWGQDATCCRAGCWCDLSLHPSIDELMHGMGYDRCLDDGFCEPCSDFEMQAPHCKATGFRQKVVCLRCQGDGLYLPYCQTGYKLFWAANATFANGTLTGPSAGLFVRSCVKARSFHLEPESQLEPESHSEPEISRPGRTTGRLHSLRDDGNEGLVEVLYFLAANALVLTTFAWSLRRQQQRQLEKTMEGLYACVEDGLPASSGGVTSPTQPKPREHRDIRSPSPESEARAIGRRR